MLPPWYLGFIVIIWLLNPLDAYVLEKADNEYILNWSENYAEDSFTLDLKENNHDGENASHLLLFTLTLNDSETFKGWTFLKASFNSEIIETDGSYQFYTKQYMDYETETDHSYTIYSNIINQIVTVVITTINIDDEPPTLTATMCTMDENTDYTETNTSCTATLSDPDGWLGNTTFQIINSNANAEKILEKENELFIFYFDKEIDAEVYSTTVYLNTLHQLDYETKIFYSFSVQAKDGAGHSTTPNADVTCIVDVGDLNDMPPEWTDYFNSLQITEKTEYSFTVTAVDGDRGIDADIIYSLLASDDGGDYCNGSCVSITTQDKKGNITVKPIDRDTKDISKYKFDILAQETDEPPYTVNLTITFFLEDLDDHSPVFLYVERSNDTDFNVENEDQKTVQFTFYENFAGAIDGNIRIQDLDTGENAQFLVELQENEERLYSNVSYTDAFLVVPTAGYKSGDFTINVKNSTYLDFENEPWQNITFYVHSSGTLNSSNEDYLLVNISLVDYNDELPIFKNSSYAVSVKENIKKGEEIITVKATDRDAEDKVLKHSLVGASTIIDVMDLDSAEGIIKVAGENYVFDYDRINPVIFQVQAVDKVDHVTTVPVTINLIDVNNKAPTYIVEDIIQVEENQVIGIDLNATITASDVDSDRDLTAEINWDRSYAMKNSQRLTTSSSNTKAMQFLDLTYQKTSTDTISITLYVNDNNDNLTAPDYETFDTLYLGIDITDLNTLVPEFENMKTTEAIIIVNIIDINDNAPIFTDQSIAKNRTIYEESPINTIVGTIEAIDLDVGTIVEYTCTYVDKNLDWFECDSSGQITAKTADIDADTGPVTNVSINCTATDQVWYTWQIFDIYILDTNNKYPQIRVNDSLPSAEIVEIQEKSPIQTLVTTVPAPDADRDIPFHTVQCRLNQGEECYDAFELDQTSGSQEFEIRVKGYLDRDNDKPNYTCTLTCIDNPNNEQNGGQKSNFTTFVIKLLDINDNCPEMKTSELETIETLEEEGLIGKVEAEDLDEGINADIIMEIETVTKLEEDGNITDYTEDGLFAMIKNDDDYYINLTRKQWHMVAKKPLRDYYGQYVIQLRLTDQGIEPQSTDDEGNEDFKEKAKLTLTIGKFNYYPPVFVFPNKSVQSFSLTADQEAGTQLAMYYRNQKLANIEISDGDDNLCLEKWNPTFDVALLDMASSVRNFFVMEKTGRCTAQLQVDDSYNKDYAINIVAFKLRLSVSLDDKIASDGEASYTEFTNITLNFIDINEDPIFDQTLRQWNVSFLEADATQIQELPDERKAFYANIDDSSDLPKYYFMDSTDEDVLETFEIEVDSGTIKLEEELDYLVKTFYTFDMLAGKNQSTGSDKTASKMTVNVTVIDINNHVPQWTESSFYGAILSTTEKGSTVVTLNATDLDTIDQGNLVYSLNSTIESVGYDKLHNIEKPFLLDESTGVITLNFKVEVNMYGYFTFWVKVQDHEDSYGNGPFENITVVNITIITSDNTVTFKFENTLDTVVEQKAQVLETISSNLGWSCHFKDIAKYSENGVQFDNVTAADVYCIDSNNNLLTADDMKSKLNNINTYQQLKQKLLSYGILLQTFQSGETAVDKLEDTLKIALISVSVVLGAACIILGVTFVFKIRELQNRLEKLTRQDFGSDESAVNRNGINNIPTSNVFAVEGANPIFNIKMDNDVIKDDVLSIHSGNSDLIGVEDNPEFDEIFGKEKF